MTFSDIAAPLPEWVSTVVKRNHGSTSVQSTATFAAADGLQFSYYAKILLPKSPRKCQKYLNFQFWRRLLSWSWPLTESEFWPFRSLLAPRPTLHHRTILKQSRAMQRWVIDDLTNFSRPICRWLHTSVTSPACASSSEVLPSPPVPAHSTFIYSGYCKTLRPVPSCLVRYARTRVHCESKKYIAR